MTVKPLILFLIISCMAAAAVRSQPAVRLDHGQFDRNGGDQAGSVNGTFRFLGTASDISGKLSGSPTSGVYTLCDFYGSPCAPGSTIRILDKITGSSGLRQDAAPIIINGTSYPTVYYFGQITFSGGTVRLPFSAAKRKTFKITVGATVTGGIVGYPTPTSTEAIFGSTLDLNGTVTLIFNRKDNGSTAPTYNLVSVTYVFQG
jgi:hypothetical protein